MTAADQLMERGRAQGRREMLLDLLRQRFGELPGATVAQVAVAGLEELQAWSMRVLTAPRLDDVFAGS
jgi:hypothetical protein